jgi:hypothetical protein
MPTLKKSGRATNAANAKPRFESRLMRPPGIPGSKNSVGKLEIACLHL